MAGEADARSAPPALGCCGRNTLHFLARFATLALAQALFAPPAAAGLPPQVRIVQWPRSGIDVHRAESVEIELDVVAADAFAGVLEMRIGDAAGADREMEVAVPLEMAAGSRMQRALALPLGRRCPLVFHWWLRASDGSVPVTGEGVLQCPRWWSMPEPAWLLAADVPSRTRWLSTALVLIMEGADFAGLDESRRDVLLHAVACGRTLALVRPLAPLPAALEREIRRDDASCWRGTHGEEIREIAYGLGTIREVGADVHAEGREWPLARFALGSRARRWLLIDLGTDSDRPWWHPKAARNAADILDAGPWSTPMGAAAEGIARARRMGAAIAALSLMVSLGLVMAGRFRRSSRPVAALGAAVLMAPFLVWLSVHRRPVPGIDADLEVVYHDPRGLVSVRELTRSAGGSGGADPSIALCPEADSQIAFPLQGLSTLRIEATDDGCVAVVPVAGLPSARRWVSASMRTPMAADPAWDAEVRWENGAAVGRVTARRRFDVALLALPPRVVKLGAIEAGQSHDVGPMIEAVLGGASSLLDGDVHAAVELALSRAGDGVAHPLVRIGLNRRASSAGGPPLLVEVQGVEIDGDVEGGASQWGRVVPYSWSGAVVSEGASYAAVPVGGEVRGFGLPPTHAADIGGREPWQPIDPASQAPAHPADPSWLILPVPAERSWRYEPGFEILLRWNAPEAKP